MGYLVNARLTRRGTPPSAIGGPAPLEEGKKFVHITVMFTPLQEGMPQHGCGGGVPPVNYFLKCYNL